jgi:hypothetical protein
MGCSEPWISYNGLLHPVTTVGKILNDWSTVFLIGKISPLGELKKEKALRNKWLWGFSVTIFWKEIQKNCQIFISCCSR